MPRYNVSKKHGKSKIKISEKRGAAMREIGGSNSEEFGVTMTVAQELFYCA